MVRFTIICHCVNFLTICGQNLVVLPFKWNNCLQQNFHMVLFISKHFTKRNLNLFVSEGVKLILTRWLGSWRMRDACLQLAFTGRCCYMGFGFWPPFLQGFWYFAEKEAKFRGIFRGKFAEKSADFVGFSQEESQNSWKNRPISGIFAGKKSKFVEKSADFAGFSRKNVKFRRIFRGKFLEKSADFTGNLGGKQKQKQPISLDFWWEISLKSINFASIWPALVNVFFNRDNYLLFQQQFAQEMSEC